MGKPLALTIHVAEDADRPGRYRWIIRDVGKDRDKSLYTFATYREAFDDAEKFRDKLVITWQKTN
jgi:hypothetical protein